MKLNAKQLVGEVFTYRCPIAQLSEIQIKFTPYTLLLCRCDYLMERMRIGEQRYCDEQTWSQYGTYVSLKNQVIYSNYFSDH